ncbi:MAG: FtsQ-type POTRA domain-containing protein [Deltaproteobacteria bacterium]|jgi:cell division septal protein FtsQ|nr:FtsQ-type POTRA domain-containing protein [Deltaproteobacteria bacterium]
MKGLKPRAVNLEALKSGKGTQGARTIAPLGRLKRMGEIESKKDQKDKRRLLRENNLKKVQESKAAESSQNLQKKDKRPFLTALKTAPRVVRRAFSLIFIGVISAVILAIVSGGCIWAYLYFTESDYFLIKNHDIKGINRVSRQEILEATGLDRPVNLLTFDTVRATRSLKSLPWVEDATISRTPPPDGITIRVTEYKPRAIVNLEQLYYIDEKGRPFKSLAAGEIPDLPFISGFTLDALLEGGPMTQKAVLEIYELMDILAVRTDEWNIDNISEFRHDPDIGVTIFRRDIPLEIRVGPGPFTEKVLRLTRVMDWLKNNNRFEGLIFANLECVPRVIVRYEKGKIPGNPLEMELALGGRLPST